ncbi:MAG: hypothetical protein U0441_16365 [Polyangiaceae bacterium]
MAVSILSVLGCGEAEGALKEAAPCSATGGDGGGTGTSTGGAISTGQSLVTAVPVTVVDYGSKPMSDIPIVVNGADGAVLWETKTDGNGRVLVLVPQGGSVSAFGNIDSGLRMETVVEPPGEVQFQFSPKQQEMPDPAQVTTYHITALQAPANTKSIGGVLEDGCTMGSAAPGAKFDLTDGGCLGQTTHRLRVGAFDSDNRTLRWADQDLPTAPGTTVNVEVTLNQTAVWSTVVALKDVPIPVHEVNVDSIIVDGSPAFWLQLRESPYNSSTFTKTLEVPKFADFPVCVYGAATVGDGSTGSSAGRGWCDNTPPDTFDVDVSALQWIYVTALDTSDLKHPTVTWSATPGPPQDVITIGWSWHASMSWVGQSVSLPPDHATSFRLFDIPEDLKQFRPTAFSDNNGAYVTYSERDDVHGYADAVDGKELQANPTGASVGAQSWIYAQPAP